MRKLISPAIFWVAFFLATLMIVIRKYVTDMLNLFTFNFGYMLILGLFLICSLYTYFFDKRKSRAASLASFFFGLAFWIPLLNMIFAVPALYLGLKALKKIRKNPRQYGGRWFAFLGIALGALVYITYLIGVLMCIYGYKDICRNIGLAFLTN